MATKSARVSARKPRKAQRTKAAKRTRAAPTPAAAARKLGKSLGRLARDGVSILSSSSMKLVRRAKSAAK